MRFDNLAKPGQSGANAARCAGVTLTSQKSNRFPTMNGITLAMIFAAVMLVYCGQIFAQAGVVSK